uniref:Uncharacterized protein n=1 Tax=Sphaerodactylus townsendi TaxID=933632 RepID=A0ACB8EP19_9SAUR
MPGGDFKGNTSISTNTRMSGYWGLGDLSSLFAGKSTDFSSHSASERLSVSDKDLSLLTEKSKHKEKQKHQHCDTGTKVPRAVLKWTPCPALSLSDAAVGAEQGYRGRAMTLSTGVHKEVLWECEESSEVWNLWACSVRSARWQRDSGGNGSKRRSSKDSGPTGGSSDLQNESRRTGVAHDSSAASELKPSSDQRSLPPIKCPA